MQKLVRRLALVLPIVGILLLAGGQRVAASLQQSPQPHPSAAPPGATVRVDGFPELNPSCPSVTMWLAADAGITATNDPRLIALSGTVTVEQGLGQSSAGPLKDVPVFTFTVPAIAAGSYLLYYTCPGSPNGWDSLEQGPSFTVTQALPGTNLAARREAPLWISWLQILFVILIASAALLVAWRRSA